MICCGDPWKEQLKEIVFIIIYLFIYPLLRTHWVQDLFYKRKLQLIDTDQR